MKVKQDDLLILKDGSNVVVCCDVGHKYLFTAKCHETKYWVFSGVFNIYEVKHNLGKI
jgi:hypothetical protein